MRSLSKQKKRRPKPPPSFFGPSGGAAESASLRVALLLSASVHAAAFVWAGFSSDSSLEATAGDGPFVVALVAAKAPQSASETPRHKAESPTESTSAPELIPVSDVAESALPSLPVESPPNDLRTAAVAPVKPAAKTPTNPETSTRVESYALRDRVLPQGEIVVEMGQSLNQESRPYEDGHGRATTVAAQSPADVAPAFDSAAVRTGLSAAAEFTHTLKPIYPRLSRRRGEEGVVKLSVQVLANGRAGDVRVLKSSGFRRLDRCAVKAVFDASFRPARSGGRAVSDTKSISIRFDLDD